ncbi:MAG TPA: alpha-amylase family glycosyl hydrolase, partial [Micavibrio sp.]
MAGLRIYYVPPRLVGSVCRWSGLDSADDRSPLIDRVKDLGFNAIWFSPLTHATDMETEKNGTVYTGSLYASRNHFSLDPEFSAAPEHPRKDEIDRLHLRRFNELAAAEGITVMADMVFNHVALDHPLVVEENRLVQSIIDGRKSGVDIRFIYRDGNHDRAERKSREGQSPIGVYCNGKRLDFKFQRNGNLSLKKTGCDGEIWSDIAKINYDSPAAMDFFVRGPQAYWKQVIDHNLDLGFTGFRCDVAYMIPPDAWSELIQHARNRNPDVKFMAETLGGGGQIEKLKRARTVCNGMDRPAFDLTMLSTHWWNYEDSWLSDETRAHHDLAQYGGTGSPDNHDTPQTVAGHFFKELESMNDEERDRIIADICARDYALAAFAGNSVYMQMGYELCRPEQNLPFRATASPADWTALTGKREGHILNIEDRIRSINRFKERLGLEHALIEVKNPRHISDERILRIDCAVLDPVSRSEIGTISLYVNKKPEWGPVIMKMPASAGAPHVLGRQDGHESLEISDYAVICTLPGRHFDPRLKSAGFRP